MPYAIVQLLTAAGIGSLRQICLRGLSRQPLTSECTPAGSFSNAPTSRSPFVIAPRIVLASEGHRQLLRLPVREMLEQLEDGVLFSFRDWPNQQVPQVAAGVYAIWRGSELVYVGMS